MKVGVKMKEKTQICAEKEDFERMRKDAKEKGMSLSAYIRFATMEYEKSRKEK